MTRSSRWGPANVLGASVRSVLTLEAGGLSQEAPRRQREPPRMQKPVVGPGEGLASRQCPRWQAAPARQMHLELWAK